MKHIDKYIEQLFHQVDSEKATIIANYCVCEVFKIKGIRPCINNLQLSCYMHWQEEVEKD